MGLRRQARELALKMLFQIDLGRLNEDDVIPYFLSDVKASPEVLDYAKQLTRGIGRELELIDRLIHDSAEPVVV